MTVQIDFALSRRFGVVEQTIFRLVLNGITNAQHISSLLWVFSDVVIANALRKLVNEQVIIANVESRILSLSDAVVALIEICTNKSFELEIPDRGLLVADNSDYNIQKLAFEAKVAILEKMLPHIKQSFLLSLAKCFDFRICAGGESYDG